MRITFDPGLPLFNVTVIWYEDCLDAGRGLFTWNLLTLCLLIVSADSVSIHEISRKRDLQLKQQLKADSSIEQSNTFY